MPASVPDADAEVPAVCVAEPRADGDVEPTAVADAQRVAAPEPVASAGVALAGGDSVVPPLDDAAAERDGWLAEPLAEP